jgi:hypothetical protein
VKYSEHTYTLRLNRVGDTVVAINKNSYIVSTGQWIFESKFRKRRQHLRLFIDSVDGAIGCGDIIFSDVVANLS